MYSKSSACGFVVFTEKEFHEEFSKLLNVLDVKTPFFLVTQVRLCTFAKASNHLNTYLIRLLHSIFCEHLFTI